MTQRFKELLDDAVSGVQPRTLDPAGAVVRRGRSQRRRAVLAGALAVLAVLGGGGLAAQQLRPGPPPRVADVDRQPPVPRFVGGVVVSGALRLPVPSGWQAVAGGQDKTCADPDHTVLIADFTKPREDSTAACPYAAITVWVSDQEMEAPSGGFLTDKRVIRTPPISMTLPGGEPVWVSNRIDEVDPDRNQSGGAYDLELVLPWSRTIIYLRMSRLDAQRVVGTLRAEPVEGGVLAVPDVPAVAELIAPGPDDEIYPRHSRTTDKAAIADVVRLLRGQTEAVADREACASPAQKGLRLDIGTAHVVVALGPHCQEAVSSAGGRVRFDDAAVTELEQLFGIAR